MKQLILGSSSPRRQLLLQELGIPFTVRTPKVDEKSVAFAHPKDTVEKLAELKAQNIEILHKDEIVIAADTIVVFDGVIFEKPKNKAEALQMIQALSGNKHNVITAVALRSSEKKVVFSVNTTVEFWPLSDEEMKAYILTDEPYDKAGAYGIQGLARIFIKKIDGDYYNVVGLPIAYVVKELRNFGLFVEKYVFQQK